jgi:hypothetical protein
LTNYEYFFYTFAFFNPYFSLIQSGSRLFGFIGAGATLGQLFGSLFAASMAWMGPCMYILSKLMA